MSQRQETAAEDTPNTPRDNLANVWSEITTPLGRLFIAAHNRRLCAVKFGRLEINRRFPNISRFPTRDDKALLNNAIVQLKDYFSGRRHKFELSVDLTCLTPFQREVLSVTSRIPWGEVWSYRRVAQEMGWPKASRAVGQALGRNPIPIVIPCHRVISSDGSLGGYCGKAGLDLKRWLLRHESAQL
jgi:methylated-DNA-[protein]-cysteine S-methyltransferase